MLNTARIELHLHLDGSLNIRWAYEKSLKRGVIPADSSFNDYYNLLFANNAKPHNVSITKFDLTCNILQTAEDLTEATYDLVRRLANQGIWYAEIRFASQQHCKEGLSQKEALYAVIHGARKGMEVFPDIRIGIINCLMHKGDSAKVNWEENLETIRVTKEMLGKGAVGLDLAGFENNCDYNEYAPLFELAKQEGIPFTLHAGEMGIGEHVLDAIAMGASRIGHGVNCLQSEEYLNKVLETQIPLEVCVTSNVKRDMNYGNHAILTLLEKGARVTLNSDNMMFARTDLTNEHAQMRMLGVSNETLLHCTRNAIEAAFCDEPTKVWLRSRLEQEVLAEEERKTHEAQPIIF